MSISGKIAKKTSFLVVVVILLIITLGLVRSLLGYLKLDDRFLLAETEVEKLEEENINLEKSLYEDDREYVVEKELRDSLGYSRQGEVVVVLPEELVEQTMKEREEVERDIIDTPNWKKWASLFF
jgi:cell division protein FtsB